MNDTRETIETRGEYRVSIEIMDYAEPPDWDGQGTIVLLDLRRHHAYVQHPSKGDDFGLGELWRYWRGHGNDMALIERYLRIFHGVVGFDYFDTQDAKYVCLVTESDLREWGFDDLDAWRTAVIKHDLDPNPAVGNLNAWRHWIEGEVYGYIIERAVIRHTRTLDMNLELLGEDRETGWDEVESCWGYYGEQDAKEQALEAFSGYVSDTEGSVPA